jgi:hypothetical protein
MVKVPRPVRLIRGVLWSAFLAPATLVATGIGLHYLAVPARSADQDEPCLTREQAKKQYPGAYLYWRTARRCWYGVTPNKRPPPRRHLATVSKPVAKEVDYCCWPTLTELDSNGNVVKLETLRTFLDRWNDTLEVWRWKK